jgi:HK97 family phage major capsid protein
MSATLSLREVEEKLSAKRRELADILDRHKVDGEYKMSADAVDDVRQRNAELKDLGEKLDQMRDIEAIGKSLAGQESRGREMVPGGGAATTPAESKAFDLGAKIEGNRGFQAFREGKSHTYTLHLTPAETKTLLTLSDMTPTAERRPMVDMAQPYRAVSDLMVQGDSNRTSLEYYEETTFTNNAAEVAEGASKPESALDWTLRTEAWAKIATFLPVTDEFLADNAGVRGLIENRLRFMVVKRREQQLLIGNGTAPNLSGILDRSGIQTQAKGADPTFDAIMKAATLIRYTADAEPTGIVMHPNDWQDLALTRTADGLYILGNPDSGEAARRIWGMEVRVVPAMTENTALVGAFRPYSEFIQRSGLVVTASTEHSTYFIENKVAILAEERVGLAVYRPAAFATVTGI